MNEHHADTPAAPSAAYSLPRRTPLLRDLLRDPFQIAGVIIVLGVVIAALSNLIPWDGQSAEYQPDQFVRQFLFGLAQGSIYALLALGYTMIFSVVSVINFAQGEIFMAGAYAGFFAMLAGERAGLFGSQPWLVLLIVLAAGMGGSVLAALLVKQVLFRPYRSAPRLTLFVASIGASIALAQLFSHLLGASARRYPDLQLFAFSSLFPGYGCTTTEGDGVCRGIDFIGGRYDTIVLGMELRILPIHGLVLVIALLLILALWLYVGNTRMGRAMRAVADDKSAAALMGVDTNRVLTVTFVLGAILAGAGGVLFALYNHQVSPTMGFMPGIKALTAAVMGGLGNLPGAVIGGYFLGVTESVMPTMLGLSAHFKDAITFVLLITVLIFRPRGVFGATQVEGRGGL